MRTQDYEARELSRLKLMMEDQRYWKSRDPAYIEQVSDGFRRLEQELERARAGQLANQEALTGDVHSRDVMIGHLAPGEIVVPHRAQTKEVLSALKKVLGAELPRYTVGSGQERRNPVSGLPAFSPENEREDESWWQNVQKVAEKWVGNLSKRAGSVRAPVKPPGSKDPLTAMEPGILKEARGALPIGNEIEKQNTARWNDKFCGPKSPWNRGRVKCDDDLLQ